MRSTGIIRRIDDLGRIVIPREIRRNLGIHEGDAMELGISSDGCGIVLQKYRTSFADEVWHLRESLNDAMVNGYMSNHEKTREAIRKLGEAKAILREIGA